MRHSRAHLSAHAMPLHIRIPSCMLMCVLDTGPAFSRAAVTSLALTRLFEARLVTIGVPPAIGRFSIIYALYSQECLQHTFSPMVPTG